MIAHARSPRQHCMFTATGSWLCPHCRPQLVVQTKEHFDQRFKNLPSDTWLIHYDVEVAGWKPFTVSSVMPPPSGL